jgi:hypothetical protein
MKYVAILVFSILFIFSVISCSIYKVEPANLILVEEGNLTQWQIVKSYGYRGVAFVITGAVYDVSESNYLVLNSSMQITQPVIGKKYYLYIRDMHGIRSSMYVLCERELKFNEMP